MTILRSKKAAVTTCGVYLYNTLLNKILICHATNSSWKTWTIPKGLKEKDEDSYMTASRELREETGIDIGKLHILRLHPLLKIKYQKQNKFLESYLVITDSDLTDHHFECNANIDNHFPEVDKWKWIEMELLKDQLHESQLKNYDQIVELIKNA